MEACHAAPDSRRRTAANRRRRRPQNSRAARCAGWSGYCENDAATGKEYPQDRRVRRTYRLIDWAGLIPTDPEPIATGCAKLHRLQATRIRKIAESRSGVTPKSRPAPVVREAPQPQAAGAPFSPSAFFAQRLFRPAPFSPTREPDMDWGIALIAAMTPPLRMKL